MNEIKFIDPKNLYEHELLKRLPPLAADDPSVLKVAQSISDMGRIIDPLKITERGELVDGRRRLASARRLRLETVPCIYVPDMEVPMLIFAQLEARAHFTKSQRAYLMLPYIDEAFEFANARRVANLKLRHALEGNSFPFDGKRVEDWPSEAGLSDRLLKQAKELRKFFQDLTKRTLTDEDSVTEENVTFQEFFEPRIMREDSPYGLGGALAGIKQHLAIQAKGGKHGGGKPKDADKQLQLFSRVFQDQLNRWEYWEAFPEDVRSEYWRELRNHIEGLPPQRCQAMAKYHAALATKLRKAAKTAKEAA